LHEPFDSIGQERELIADSLPRDVQRRWRRYKPALAKHRFEQVVSACGGNLGAARWIGHVDHCRAGTALQFVVYHVSEHLTLMLKPSHLKDAGIGGLDRLFR
jgi:hypothetical protein